MAYPPGRNRLILPLELVILCLLWRLVSLFLGLVKFYFVNFTEILSLTDSISRLT